MSARSWASGRSSVSLGHDSTVLAMAVLDGDIDQVRALINIGVVMSDQHPWVLYQACLQGLGMIQALCAFHAGLTCYQVVIGLRTTMWKRLGRAFLLGEGQA